SVLDTRAAGLQRVDRNRVGGAEGKPERGRTRLRQAAIEREVQPSGIGRNQESAFGLERRGGIDWRVRRDTVCPRPRIAPGYEHEPRIGSGELGRRRFEPMGGTLVPPERRRGSVRLVVDENGRARRSDRGNRVLGLEL